ncbi:choice-of-anchor J domain-containing protein, partial [Nocardioides hankookensis]
MTTRDFALTAAPSVTVRGTVTDGGGHGWPLYAKVDIAGPAPDVWTDPTTGDYSVDLPSGATYSMTVTADLPGYLPSTADVAVGASDVTHDVALQVDDSTCTAPGYVFNTAGVTEDFSGEALPDGWTVTDGLDNGQVWTFDDPGGQGNLTGGEGGFAIVDSDNYGSDGEQDTSLVSPVVDMSDLTAPVVGFAQDYNNLGDSADVDVSIDGGDTWETVLHQTTDVRGPRTDVIQLPMAAGQSQVQVRFHYYDASYAWWWEVDDVFVGNRTCDPVEGGLVVGNVRGSTGRTGINGATVTSIDQPADKATTKPTPDDPAVDDGFYQLFSSLTGRHPFEAAAKQHQSQRKTVNVPRNRTVAASFRLAAGHLTVTPTSIATTAKLGGAPKSGTFTLTNDGTAPVNVELGERDGGFVMQRADGTKQDLSQLSKSEGAPLQRLKAPVSLTSTGSGKAAATSAAAAGTQDAPWTDLADYPSAIMDNAVVNVDGTIYSIAGGDGSASTAAVYAYDPESLAWTAKADLPGARNAAAAGVVDGKIVAAGGWADGGPATDTWVYDPSAD